MADDEDVKKSLDPRLRLYHDEARKQVGEAEFNRWLAAMRQDKPIIVAFGLLFIAVLVVLFLMMP